MTDFNQQLVAQKLLAEYWASKSKVTMLISEYDRMIKEANSLVEVQHASDAITFELQKLRVLQYRLIKLNVEEKELLNPTECLHEAYLTAS